MSDPFRPGRRAPETEVERAWNRLFADCRHPDMSGKKAVFQADVLLVLDALEQAQSALTRLREAAARAVDTRDPTIQTYDQDAMNALRAALTQENPNHDE